MRGSPVTMLWMREVWLSRALMERFDFRQMTQNLFLKLPPFFTSLEVGRQSSVIGGRTTLNPAASDEDAGPSAPSSPSIISKNLDTSSAAEDEPDGADCGAAVGGVASSRTDLTIFWYESYKLHFGTSFAAEIVF